MEVHLHNKVFTRFIDEKTIRKRVQELSAEISVDYKDKTPLFIAVLNGAVVFAADLIRAFDGQCELTFVKLSSYQGTQSSGGIKTDIGLNVDIKDRHVIVLEDIVDTGRTLTVFLQKLTKMQTASIAVATFLVKPTAHLFPVAIKYAGMEIPDDFVVGYGLDYDGLGRNLKDIYKISSIV